jgi:hypothetical protein
MVWIEDRGLGREALGGHRYDSFGMGDGDLTQVISVVFEV